MSPNPANDIIVFSLPPNFLINFLVSFILSVKNIALVDLQTPMPSKIPAVIAIMFFKVPQSSTPKKSLVGRILSVLDDKAFKTTSLVVLFVVASERPINSSFAISLAKEGPDIVHSFLVFNLFFTILLAKLLVSFSIPLDAITICLSFIYGFIFSQTEDKYLVATAKTTILLPSKAFLISQV